MRGSLLSAYPSIWLSLDTHGSWSYPCLLRMSTHCWHVTAGVTVSGVSSLRSATVRAFHQLLARREEDDGCMPRGDDGDEDCDEW